MSILRNTDIILVYNISRKYKKRLSDIFGQRRARNGSKMKSPKISRKKTEAPWSAGSPILAQQVQYLKKNVFLLKNHFYVSRGTFWKKN